MEQHQDYAVGIDLGTTYSCIGIWKNGKVEIVHNEGGQSTTPSYVSFFKDLLLVGDAALTKAGPNAVNTIYDIKRLIGRDYNDPHVQKDMKNWPYKVIKGADGLPEV